MDGRAFERAEDSTGDKRPGEPAEMFRKCGCTPAVLPHIPGYFRNRKERAIVTACIKCSICGKTWHFDTNKPICPEAAGWMELTPAQAWNGIFRDEPGAHAEPVCPDCIKRRADLTKDYDPFSSK